MILFGDSGGWLAMYDERDKYHPAAKRFFNTILDRPVSFLVTDYVIAETLTLMRGKLGHRKTVAFGEWLLDAPQVRQVRLEVDLWNEAWHLFKKYDDKEFSFADCASFAVMRREHLVDAFTFDHHFEQMGFRLWPGEKMMPPHVIIEQFTSRVLADNPLGDPATRSLPIILPPEYEMSGKRYPVIYGLTGFTGSGPMMLNLGAWQPNLPQRIDRLTAEGKLPPAIYVLPDCFTRYGGSQYLNSTAIGRYEDYVIDEIVPHIDRAYRTIAAPGGRGVFGKSSGGYGAIVLGMRHPDVFGAVACHSGDMYFELCYKSDFPKFLNEIQKAGGLKQWWIEFERKVKKEHRDVEAVDILAMAAAYSPNPSATPFPIDFPFDLDTGELKPEVWARWLELDPVYMVDRYADNLKKLRLLFVDCGTRDEFNLHFGARILVRKLKALGVPHEHEEFDDGHMNVQYRYDVSLPKIARALAAAA